MSVQAATLSLQYDLEYSMVYQADKQMEVSHCRSIAMNCHSAKVESNTSQFFLL